MRYSHALPWAAPPGMIAAAWPDPHAVLWPSGGMAIRLALQTRLRHYHGYPPRDASMRFVNAATGNYWDTDPRSSMTGHPGRSFPFTPVFVGS